MRPSIPRRQVFSRRDLGPVWLLHHVLQAAKRKRDAAAAVIANLAGQRGHKIHAGAGGAPHRAAPAFVIRPRRLFGLPPPRHISTPAPGRRRSWNHTRYFVVFTRWPGRPTGARRSHLGGMTSRDPARAFGHFRPTLDPAVAARALAHLNCSSTNHFLSLREQFLKWPGASGGWPAGGGKVQWLGPPQLPFCDAENVRFRRRFIFLAVTA
jgi:hypothetical protein